MSFLIDIPDYKTLQSDSYYMSEVPDKIWGSLEAYALRAISVNNIQYVVNRLNNIALLPPTQNWGWGFLKNDLSYAIDEIRKKVYNKGKFHLFMDTIETILEMRGFNNLDEVNELFEEYNIGYTLVFSDHYVWKTRENVADLSRKIEITKELVKTKSQQALEHLEQAKRQLTNSSDERARKDAVRDCASAMETIIKLCGGVNDIENATKELRKQMVWGINDIVKDGISIFSTLHRLYPDLRHGSTEKSEMPLNEALYWIGRMTTYIDYLIRQKNQLGRED